MWAHALRRLIVVAVLAFLLVGFILVGKWAVNIAFSGTKTVKTQHFAPQFGILTLSAKLVSKNEVVLNLTFSGTAYVNYPGYNWTLWVSRTSAGKLHETLLPEGLKLVGGALKVTVIGPLHNNLLSLWTRLRAITDGEWVVYGRFSATHESNPPNPAPEQCYGWSCCLSTRGIKIVVSNGGIAQMEEACYPTNSATQKPGSPAEQMTNPPIHRSIPWATLESGLLNNGIDASKEERATD